MKRFLTKSFVAVLTSAISLSGALSLNSNAATVDDCAAVARSYGVSETAIQAAYNTYYANPDAYTSEDFDYVIDCLHIYGEDSNALIHSYFGVSDDMLDDNNSSDDSSNESSNSSSDNNSSSSSSNNSSSSSSSNNNSSSSSGDNGSSNSSSSSSSSTSNYVRPIESSEFINMTLEEKMDFVNNLSDSQKVEFINNLTNEEKNSIIKQASVDDKMTILSKFSEVSSAMGLNLTIDELTDESVSMSIRNEDGMLVEQSSLGVIIEDTGYDYRKMLGIIGALILISGTGLFFFTKKINVQNKEK